MTLAEAKRPEANLLIELSQYALQRHTHWKYEVDMSNTTFAEYLLVPNKISDAMPNSQIKAEGSNSESYKNILR